MFSFGYFTFRNLPLGESQGCIRKLHLKILISALAIALAIVHDGYSHIDGKTKGNLNACCRDWFIILQHALVSIGIASIGC